MGGASDRRGGWYSAAGCAAAGSHAGRPSPPLRPAALPHRGTAPQRQPGGGDKQIKRKKEEEKKASLFLFFFLRSFFACPLRPKPTHLSLESKKLMLKTAEADLLKRIPSWRQQPPDTQRLLTQSNPLRAPELMAVLAPGQSAHGVQGKNQIGGGRGI
jgi:hypothetical protein